MRKVTAVRRGRHVEFEMQESIRRSFGSDTDLVRATIGDKEKFLIEKSFPEHMHEVYCEAYSYFSRILRKRKLSVVPTVRVVKENGRLRLFLTDLSCGKKYSVIDFVDRADEVVPAVCGLKNSAEVGKKIMRETEIAEDNGLIIKPRAWVIQVDPKTNKGKPFIFDLKWIMEF